MPRLSLRIDGPQTAAFDVVLLVEERTGYSVITQGEGSNLVLDVTAEHVEQVSKRVRQLGIDLIESEG